MEAAALADLDLDELRRRRSAKWSVHEPDVLPAWVAEMDYPLAPAVKRVLLEAIELDDCGYGDGAGAGLGDAFAGFAADRWSWRPEPGLVTPLVDVVSGTYELLRVLTEPGDGVIINPPVYHPFFGLVADAGRRLVEVPLAGGRELDVDGIGAAFAAGARALILCNPHNPTGAVLARDELVAVAELAAEHEAWVLADEIHAPLAFPGAEHLPFVTVSEAAASRGIVLSSASKAFNIAGLKCALAVTAGEPATSAVGRLPEIARHSGHLGIVASVAAFAQSGEWLDAVVAQLDSNRRELGRLLAERLPEIGYEPPAAGYLAWLDCRGLGLGPDPAAVLLERGRVALSAGPTFGAAGSGFVRLNFATSPALLEEIVERIARGAGK